MAERRDGDMDAPRLDCSDAAILPGGTALLRAARDGRGNGRVYTIAFTASDAHGATCEGSVQVCVPLHPARRDPRHAGDEFVPCIDDGQQVSSIASCRSRTTTLSTGASLEAGPDRGAPRVLRYSIPVGGDVRIALYDVAGRRVAELYTGPQRAGAHELPWTLRGLGHGVYFCRVQVGAWATARSLVIVE